MGHTRPLLNRRTFMTTGAIAAVGGAAWVGVSSSWGARFLRQRFEEVGREIPPAPFKPNPSSWPDNAVTLAWLGHATVLINFYGLRILTDPALYPRIGVDLGLGTLGPLRLVRTSISCSCRTRTSTTWTHPHSDRSAASRRPSWRQTSPICFRDDGMHR
jgi:hypothetical protein